MLGSYQLRHHITLGKCRCIKPNPESQPGSLTPNYVLEQLRAGGVLEAVRIACAGFPTRKAFRPFAIRYNILLASGRGAYRHLDPETLQDDEAADISRKVLQAVKIMGWQLGKTRVFLRAGQLAQLEVCAASHPTHNRPKNRKQHVYYWFRFNT